MEQSTLNNNAFSQINNSYMNATHEFLNSDSLVAKFSFLLLVLLLFMIVFRLGMTIIGHYFSLSKSPKLINGMIDAKQLMVIPQDPNSLGAKPILRSENENKGIEFTWSVWIYIDDLTYKSGQYKCVFYKGNDFAKNPDIEANGLNFPNNAPGLYIAPDTNDLIIMMNTFDVINEEITVKDIPMNKWVNVIIRCQNNIIDVYINGTVVKSHHLHGVPKQNYGDVYVSPNGGFSGYTADLWYYNYALEINDIGKLMAKGPNKNMNGLNSILLNTPNYLSLRWFFSQ